MKNYAKRAGNPDIKTNAELEFKEKEKQIWEEREKWVNEAKTQTSDRITELNLLYEKNVSELKSALNISENTLKEMQEREKY